jgi:hypothetical protein
MDTDVMSPSKDTAAAGDNIRQAAAAALADVNALAVEGEDRKIVLKALLEARLDVSAPAAPTFHGAAGHVKPDPAALNQPVDDRDVMGKISAVLKVDRDTLELVYALQDNEPHVVVAPKRIAPNKAEATRQLGQLVAAARQAAGLEEWTSTATIRKIVTDYGRLDGGNFAASIQQMDSVAVIRGKGQQREVKITKPGLEATADLIKSLAGPEG